MRSRARSKLHELLLIALSILAYSSSSRDLHAAPAGATLSPEPIDYTLLSHDLDVTMIRAGAHNGEKPNQYFFKVTAYGFIDSPEERAKDLASRKKASSELGTFGETELDPLAYWRQDSKAKQFKQLHIDGKTVRDLVAKTMTQLQISENQVTIQTDISLIAKRKKYFVLPDDQVIATVSFTPLIKIGSGAPSPDQSFTLTDDKGAVAKLNVKFSASSATSEKAPK